MTDQQRDKYLRRKYGISLEDYQRMLEEQDGKCWICRRPPGTRSLAVDHDHKAKRIKVDVLRLAGGVLWRAKAWYRGQFWYSYELPQKRKTIQHVREQLKKASVRGLLCPHCNSGLRKYSDLAERFERAALYLRRFSTV
jgi:hypothetical protein